MFDNSECFKVNRQRGQFAKMLKMLSTFSGKYLHAKSQPDSHCANNAKRANAPYSACIMLIGFITLTATFMSEADNIEHVNVGRVEVVDQSIASQQKAGKLALEQVFIKLSGNTDVAKESEIAKAVDNYEQFLIASSFIQQGQRLVFEASFNQDKIQSLLIASGRDVWTSLRPSAVLWLAFETNDKQQALLSQSAADVNLRSSTDEKIQSVRLKSFARGVDIVIPLGDLDDSMNVSVYDVWNQFVSRLQDHSLRYNTDYLISATVQAFNDSNEQSPPGTTHKVDYIIAHVDFRKSNKVNTGRIFGESENDVILKLVDEYANVLAQEFALNSESQTLVQAVQATISGIESLQDYVQMMALINSVPSVEKVRLIKQRNDVASIEIVQKISITQLISILTLDRRISAKIQSSDDAVSFRWQGE